MCVYGLRVCSCLAYCLCLLLDFMNVRLNSSFMRYFIPHPTHHTHTVTMGQLHGKATYTDAAYPFINRKSTAVRPELNRRATSRPLLQFLVWEGWGNRTREAPNTAPNNLLVYSGTTDPLRRHVCVCNSVKLQQIVLVSRLSIRALLSVCPGYCFLGPTRDDTRAFFQELAKRQRCVKEVGPSLPFIHTVHGSLCSHMFMGTHGAAVTLASLVDSHT